jgi:hypothetical protein
MEVVDVHKCGPASSVEGVVKPRRLVYVAPVVECGPVHNVVVPPSDNPTSSPRYRHAKQQHRSRNCAEVAQGREV